MSAYPNILVTCPPMLGLIEEFSGDFEAHGLACTPAQVSQILSEDELIETLPRFDGWIAGDDPATRRVVMAGAAGKLRAAIKWGVGIDNIDFDAFRDANIPVENTPGVFGREVADIALAYTIGLARETYFIDREIRAQNAWPKPSGISLAGRKAALVGFGDIGAQLAKRLIACGVNVIAYDPAYRPAEGIDAETAQWPDRLGEADFLIFTCPLNDATHHMFNAETLPLLKPGLRVVNVGRGPLIDETALIAAMQKGVVHSAALDVFEVEPLGADNPLRQFERCIFGSHNGSNSADAVRRVSRIAIGKMAQFLGTGR